MNSSSVTEFKADGVGTSPNVNNELPPRSRVAPYIAFFVMVFASMAAAAALVSEAPMIVVGLY